VEEVAKVSDDVGTQTEGICRLAVHKHVDLAMDRFFHLERLRYQRRGQQLWDAGGLDGELPSRGSSWFAGYSYYEG